LSDEVFDDIESVKSGDYEARLEGIYWEIFEGDKYIIRLNPFSNRFAIIEEMKRLGMKIDKRLSESDQIKDFVKTKNCGRFILREYKKLRRRENAKN